jgi:hypothetical protein
MSMSMMVMGDENINGYELTSLLHLPLPLYPLNVLSFSSL